MAWPLEVDSSSVGHPISCGAAFSSQDGGDAYMWDRYAEQHTLAPSADAVSNESNCRMAKQARRAWAIPALLAGVVVGSAALVLSRTRRDPTG